MTPGEPLKFRIGDAVRLVEGPDMPEGWAGFPGMVLDKDSENERFPYSISFIRSGRCRVDVYTPWRHYYFGTTMAFGEHELQRF